MSKKKTHEEYVEEVKIKNPTVEVVGEYVNAKTKILHKCLIHDVKWESLPSNILKGKGCSKCLSERISKSLTSPVDQYIEKLKKSNSAIELVGNFNGLTAKTLHHCKVHDIYWESIPNNMLNGQGCYKCKIEKIGNAHRKPQDKYKEELKELNPNLELIGEYINSNTKIEHKCIKHDVNFYIAPNNALRGDGCRECRNEKVYEKMAKTHEEYIEEVELINPNIIVVGQYINSKTPILHKCIKHNIEWESCPSNILKGCGCSLCGSEKNSLSNSKNHDEYLKELKLINPNITSLGTYVNVKTSILHRCEIHGVEWYTTPASTLQGCGCPECKSEKISNSLLTTHDEYIEKLKCVNANISVIGCYSGSNVKIKHKCIICDNEWYAKPSNILSGYGCPKCSQSKGESTINDYLCDKNILYEPQKKFDDCKDKNALPFDFYLPDFNICIEYQGKQHYEPVEYFGGEEGYAYRKRHDNIKREYCKNNNIRLLEIPYWENIEETLNNFLFI